MRTRAFDLTPENLENIDDLDTIGFHKGCYNTFTQSYNPQPSIQNNQAVNLSEDHGQ